MRAALEDTSLYGWSPVPLHPSQALDYVDTALAWQRAGGAWPFATVRVDDGAVVGLDAVFRS